ncbi:MAG: hypothetical protein J6C23_01370 [Clostridia bacterium]|nr:hypothetical protein [Clostridia bacterium]
MKKLFVSDVTLRAKTEELKKSVSFKEKLAICDAIVKTGVDAIELPTLSLSKEDAVVYRTIIQSVKNCQVRIPVGFTDESFTAATEMAKNAKNAVLQVIMPTSTVVMEYTYHLKAPKMLDKIASITKKASETGYAVEFVATDATRAEKGFVAQCAKTAVENGASEITVCDDAGISLPCEFSALVKEVIEAVPTAKVYVATSDKISLACACACIALSVGAQGVKTATDGDGMRPDKFADLIRTKGDDMGVESNLDCTAIHNTVSTITDNTEEVKSSKNDGETIDASATFTDIIEKIKALGYELSDEDNGKVYEEFRRVSERKGSIASRELDAIVASTAMQVPSTFHLVNYVVNSGNIITATASVTLEKDGEKLIGVSAGDGPVDAAFHAIEQIIGHHYELDDFQIQSITKGREAAASSLIRLIANGKLYSGNGVSTDIIGACIRAYVNALNKIVYEEN